MAAAESSRSYLLATTLQNTKVPVVAAELPLTPSIPSDDDTSFSEDGEGGLVGAAPSPSIDRASVVVGSFSCDGALYAIEPGGGSVALVALDPSALPEALLDGGALLLPSAVPSDDAGSYALSRIATGALCSLRASADAEAPARGSGLAEGGEPAADERGGTPSDGAAAEVAPADAADAAAEPAAVAVRVPESVAVIDEGAFEEATSLEAIEVAPGNPAYASYDGCLYSSDLSRLLLIPGGRAGAVRIPSQTREISPSASSHCAEAVSLVVEADRSNSLLGDVEIRDAHGELVEVRFADDGRESDRPTSVMLEGTEEDAASDGAVVDVLMPAIEPQSISDEETLEDDVLAASYADTGTSEAENGVENNTLMVDSANAFRSIVAPDPEPATTGALPCIYKDASGASCEITAQMVAEGQGNSAIAGWSFNPSSGLLKVWSQNGAIVSNLWSLDGINGDVSAKDGYWGPLRSQIVSIDTTELSGAANMAAWFRETKALEDIAAVRIPDGTAGTGQQGIPVSLSRMFSGSGLISVPSTFVVPEGVKNMHCTFAVTDRLVSIYEGFSIPASCTAANGIFGEALSLESIPGSLLKNHGTTGSLVLNQAFDGCVSLATIRDGFAIPECATSIAGMFAACPSLSYLPASFSLKAFGAKGAYNAFGYDIHGHDSLQFDPKIMTYYAGDDLTELFPTSLTQFPPNVEPSAITDAVSYWNECYGRQLVTTGTVLELYVREKESGWSTLPWKTLYCSDGPLANAPSVPSFWQTGFTGWHDAIDDRGALTGSSISFPYALPTAIEGTKKTVRLYAEFVSIAGALPCSYIDALGNPREITAEMVANDQGNSAIAGWSFDSVSGLLKVWSQDGAIVTNLWTLDGFGGDVDASSGYWGPLRSLVVSIDTSDLSGATNMAAWFREMGALEDITNVRIPDGTAGTGEQGIPQSLSRIFSSSGLISVPSTFVIPEGVKNMHCMFAKTVRLTSVYEGFSVPASCSAIHGIFEGASALESIPGSFLSNHGASGSLAMEQAFNGCSSLVTIRDGFAIPECATNINGLFAGCSSLSYLPASLSLKKFGDRGACVAFGLDERRTDTPQFDPKVTTYYAGDDLNELFPISLAQLPSNVDPSAVTDVISYWDECYGRQLVMAGTTLELYVRDDSKVEWPENPWKTLYLANDVLDIAPSVPSFWNMNFTGWYGSLTDEGDLAGVPVSFPYEVTEVEGLEKRKVKLYAEYSAVSGALPCRYVDASGATRTITPEMIMQGEGNAVIAGWSFDQATGNLKIWSQQGATVTKLWGQDYIGADGDASKEELATNYWGPLRNIVVSADTNELSGAEKMSAWFSGMSRLVDIANVRIPDGSRGTGVDGVPRSLSRMFSGSGVSVVRSSFVIPYGVESSHCIFAACTRLVSVYEGFSFPSSCRYLGGAFGDAIRLEAIPGTIFENYDGTTAVQMNQVFEGCASLSALRDGFSIPEGATYIYQVFSQDVPLCRIFQRAFR